MATEPQKKAVTKIVKKIEKVILDREMISPSGVSKLVQDDPIHLNNIHGFSADRTEQLAKVVKNAAQKGGAERLLVKKGTDGKLYVVGGQNRIQYANPEGKNVSAVMKEGPVSEGMLDKSSAKQFMDSPAPQAFVKTNPREDIKVVPHTPEQFQHYAERSGAVSLDKIEKTSPWYIPTSLESALRSPSDNMGMDGLKAAGRLATGSWDKGFFDKLPFGSLLSRNVPLGVAMNYAPLVAGSDTTLFEKMTGVSAAQESTKQLKEATAADEAAAKITGNNRKNLIRNLHPEGDWTSESVAGHFAKNENYDYEIMGKAMASAVKKAGGTKEKLFSSSPDVLLANVEDEYRNIVRQTNEAQRKHAGKETRYADPSKYFKDVKEGQAAFAFPEIYMMEGGRIGVKGPEGEARYVPFIVSRFTPASQKDKSELIDYGNNTTFAFMDTAKKGHDAYTPDNPFVSKNNKPKQTK